MKKIFFKSFSVLLALIMLTVQTQSLSARPINAGLQSIGESALNLDQESLNAAMQELNALETYLDQNAGVTYNDLAAVGSELILNVSASSSPLGFDQDGENVLGIPPFLWGCVLGWVGLLIVYIATDNDRTQVKKALTGCLIGTGVSVALYAIYAVWLINEVQ